MIGEEFEGENRRERKGGRKERTEELFLLPRSSDRVYGAHCSSGGGSG